MRLHIGSYIYRATTTTSPIYHEGQLCAGLTLFGCQRILVAAELPLDQKFQVLTHEAWHAYEHHYQPLLLCEEARCDHVGHVALGLARDLFGSTALRRALRRLDG